MRPQKEAPVSVSINLGLLLHQAEIQATRTLNDRLANLGITARHFGVLLLVHRDGIDTQKELVARLISDKTAMVRLVDDLDRMGCLTRTPSTRDRRMSHLALTAEGIALFENAIQRAQQAVNDLFGGLSPTEQQTLASALTHVIGVTSAR
jgi:DNA-binding MarR family transcriptional regulator